MRALPLAWGVLLAGAALSAPVDVKLAEQTLAQHGGRVYEFVGAMKVPKLKPEAKTQTQQAAPKGALLNAVGISHATSAAPSAEPAGCHGTPDPEWCVHRPLPPHNHTTHSMRPPPTHLDSP